MGGSPRRNCALSWCIRVNWRSSKRRPTRLRKRRKLRLSLRTSGRGKPAGLRVRRMPQQRSRSMSTGGRRGRRPQAWRSHAVRYRVVAATRPTRRARRGRPAKTDSPPTEAGYRLVVEVEALGKPEEDNGWTVLATTVSAEVCTDAEGLQAYQEQHTTVEPGFRWIKNPAAIAPVWLEKPERIAALAMLTVVGLLVYSVIQRQVRLYLRTHAQQLPGNKGMTAIPTAAVVLALFAQVALVQLRIDEHEVTQLSGVQPQHLLVCAALGLDSSWYAVSSSQKDGRDI